MSWKSLALRISADFESPGDPWGNIVGNFDGAVLTCGALGWTFSGGNQQALVMACIKRCGVKFVDRTMPISGELYLDCSKNLAKGTAIISTWSSGGVAVKEPFKSELKALWSSPEMQEEQQIAASKMELLAANMAATWRGDLVNVTAQDLCFFYDIAVQNGGLRGLGLSEVLAFVDLHDGYPGAFKAVSGWLMSFGAPCPGWKQAHQNAVEWSPLYPLASLWAQRLFILAHLRARKSSPQWSAVVMARKGTIALGKGWVESELKDLRKDLGLIR